MVNEKRVSRKDLRQTSDEKRSKRAKKIDASNMSDMQSSAVGFAEFGVDNAMPLATSAPKAVPGVVPGIQTNDWQTVPGIQDPSKYSGGVLSHNDLQKAGDISGRIEAIFAEKIVGQDRMRIALMTALIADGHILLESVPGLAKTAAAKALCASIQGQFSRIQCTPDLMPSDIVGSQIYNQATGQFTTQLGPVHANLVLLDEINRSSAKTQSAMLEAMQERQTTIGDQSYALPKQFMVIATQNPIEEEGTYVLPEAQMDRFLLKELITYPTPDQEVQILNNLVSGHLESPASGMPVTLEEVAFLQEQAKRVFVSPAIIHYIISIINTTRGGGPNPIIGLDKLVRVGASPRASIAFIRVCQALALLSGRAYIIPEDVKDMCYPVLRHRILRTFDALAEGVQTESIIDQVFQVVPTP